MSHVATVDVEVKDLGALEEACRRLGLEFMTGQQTYRWYGRSEGDYPLPAGLTAEDLGRCEHAIRIRDAEREGPDAPYEIGVVRRRDGRPGWALMWDFWCGGLGLEEKVGAGCRNLKREYANVIATRAAQRQGFRVQEVRRQDGSIQLRLSK